MFDGVLWFAGDALLQQFQGWDNGCRPSHSTVLSCHGAYATGALGDQKIPARRLRVIGGKFLVLHSAFAWNLMESHGKPVDF